MIDAANDNEQLPRTLAEARLAGTPRYFTGKPCKYGHVSPRFTSNRRCIACSMAARVEWGEENRDYLREYRKTVPSAQPSVRKQNWDAWYSQNRDGVVERKRRQRAENPGSAYEWARKNPEKARAIQNNYKAKKKGNGGTHTADDIDEILHQQNFKCIECGVSVKDRKKRHIDHRIPLSRGGSNGKENIQILCKFCNLSKGAKDPYEFARTKGRLL